MERVDAGPPRPTLRSPYGPPTNPPPPNSHHLCNSQARDDSFLSDYTRRKLNSIAHWISARPRQCLN